MFIWQIEEEGEMLNRWNNRCSFVSGGKGKDIKPVKQSLFVLLSGGKRKEVQQQKHSVTLFWLKDVKPVKQSMFFL